MRIEDDDKEVGGKKRGDLIKQIQQYQEQQDKIQNEGGADPAKLDKMSTSELLNELKSIAASGEQKSTEIQAQDTQSMETRADVQSGLQGAEVSRIEQTHQQVNQTEQTAEAVGAAHKQQDAGQNWEKFAQAKEPTELPPSVEDAAKEDRQEEADRQEKQSVSARDFQNSMAMRNRMIKS